ncbi:hypothetical protein GEMRC1_003367 [Eukaryota sp. GEM-RC1]
MSSFSFPELYNFPPFFTLQPVVDTLTKQLESWCQLVLDYCQHHTHYFIIPSEMQSSDLFTNAAINRRLDETQIVRVIDALVHKGRAEWCSIDKQRALIFFRTPEEWADILSSILDKYGQKNSVCTLYELSHGDLARGTPLMGCPYDLILRAISVIQNRGQARLIEEDTLEETGVKFDIK